jgi:hypothetical protein
MLCCVVKPLTQMCTFKLLKHCRSFSEGFYVTKMLLKSSFNMATHSHTQVWKQKHRKQSQNSEGLFFPAHHTDHLASSGFRLFGALFWKRLGVMMRLLKKWRSGCKYRRQTGTRRRQMTLFLADTWLSKWWRMFRKTVCVICPPSYSLCLCVCSKNYIINYHQ